MGLALSGGGFRAAFFHLGVLAHLAEQDLLRKVEVISTVSGGSIVGALLYIEIREELQKNSKPGRDRYVALVRNLAHEVERAVQKNLRTRTFLDPWSNLRMMRESYSRSDRMAELYRELLYAPALGGKEGDSIPLRSLKVQPANEEQEFHPFEDHDGSTPNANREAKVPTIVINATTLNTGHLFQFTPTRFGEPPRTGGRQSVDGNRRLNWVHYDDAALPRKFRDLPLSIAVAASAAVPGVFAPLALTELYEELTPELVDGGVHDNQGIEGLLNLACTHLIVSDASGQMPDEEHPGTWLLPVLKRTGSILQDRVREEQHEGLLESRKAGRCDFEYLHLMDGLPRRTLDPGPQRRAEGSADSPRVTAYGVDVEVQRALAAVRTDLDSFTEVEARSLMASGYLIARRHVGRAFLGSEGGEQADESSRPAESSDTHIIPPHWHFRDMEPYLRNPAGDPRFLRQLTVAGATVFKVFRLLPLLSWGAITLGVGLVVWLLAWLSAHWGEPVAVVERLSRDLAEISTYGQLAIALATAGLLAALYLLPRRLRLASRLQRLPREAVTHVGLALVGSLAALLHLSVFDRLFLWQGRAARLREYGKKEREIRQGGPGV